jgi:hypothetical protein
MIYQHIFSRLTVRLTTAVCGISLLSLIQMPQAFAQSISPGGPSIRQGFIIVDNSCGQNTFAGTYPNNNNVFANQLGTGITVDDTTSMFATNGAVQTWQAFPHTPTPVGTPYVSANDPLVTSSTSLPAIKGLYNSDGSPATIATAGNIPYGTGANTPSTSLCTDQNSDPNDASSDPVCSKLATPQKGQSLDAFDIAYYPNAKTSTASANYSITAQALIAAEVAKVQVPGNFNTDFTLDGSSIAPTGLRLYPNDKTPDRQVDRNSNWPSWPYDPSPTFGFGADQGNGWGPTDWGLPVGSGTEGESYSNANNVGQITNDGTISQLFEQVSPGSSKTLINALTTTILQMEPVGKVSDIQSQINTIFNSQTIPLGSIYYIYPKQVTVTNPVTNQKQLTVQIVMDANGPSWLTQYTSDKNILQDIVSGLNTLTTLKSSTWNNNVQTGPITKAKIIDGTWNLSTCSYPTLDSIIDPVWEWNVHYLLYSTFIDPSDPTKPGQITANDTAAYQTTSGAYGLLGVIKFQQYLSGKLSFSNPN